MHEETSMGMETRSSRSGSMASSMALIYERSSQYANIVASHRGQRVRMVKMLTFTLIPALLLVAFTTVELIVTVKDDRKVVALKESMKESQTIGDFVHALQLELEEVMVYVSNNNQDMVATGLYKQFVTTDEVLDSILLWPQELEGANEYFQSRQLFRMHLTKGRARLTNSAGNVTTTVRFYEELNAYFIEWFTVALEDTGTGGNLWTDLLAYTFILRAKEHTSLLVAHLLEYLISGELPNQDYIEFIAQDALASDHLESCFRFRPETEILYCEFTKYMGVQNASLESLKAIVKSNGRGNVSEKVGTSPNLSEYLLSEYLLILKELEDDIVWHIFEDIAKQHRRSQKQVGLAHCTHCIDVPVS